MTLNAASIRQYRYLAKRMASGKLCSFGHTRGFTPKGACLECNRLSAVKRNADPVKREAARARQKIYYQLSNKEEYRNRNRKHRGCPVPSYPPVGFCECCGTDKPGGRGSWHADHDHKSKVFRGWLCHKCNTGLWLLGDELVSLEKATEYLRRAQQG